jgi:hypothetical protein
MQSAMSITLRATRMSRTSKSSSDPSSSMADTSMIAKSTLNCVTKSTAAQPITAPSDRRMGGPRDDHLNPRMAVEGHCDIQIVCDDEQVSRPASARDLLDGRPDVDEERRIVRNDFCGRDADGTLFILRDQATRLIGDILDAGKHNGVAMDPRQQPHRRQSHFRLTRSNPCS